MVGAMGTDGRSEFQVPSEAGYTRIRRLNLGVDAGVGMHVRSPMPGQARAQWPRYGLLLKMASIFAWALRLDATSALYRN